MRRHTGHDKQEDKHKDKDNYRFPNQPRSGVEVLALWGRHSNHRGLRNHWKYNQPLGPLQKVSLFFAKGEQCTKLQAWFNQMGELGHVQQDCVNLCKRRANSLKEVNSNIVHLSVQQGKL